MKLGWASIGSGGWATSTSGSTAVGTLLVVVEPEVVVDEPAVVPAVVVVVVLDVVTNITALVRPSPRAMVATVASVRPTSSTSATGMA